jgi:hypothetical protein
MDYAMRMNARKRNAAVGICCALVDRRARTALYR